MHQILNALKQHYQFVVVWLLLLIVGMLSYSRYGVSYDERAQREIGYAFNDYVFRNDTTFYHFNDRDHGGIFEMALVGIEKNTHTRETRNIFLQRHLISHLFFLVCLIFGYLLFLNLYKNKTIAVVIILALALHPRLYTHSFFNTKDMPFMGLSIVALYFAYQVLKNNRIRNFIVLGIVCGLASSIRLLGIIFPLLVFVFIGLKMLLQRDIQPLKGLIAFSVFFLFFFYLCFPTLWPDPIKIFLEMYQSFALFRWDASVLLNGELIKATELPWYYLPEWIGVTTPISLLLAAVIGIIIYLKKIFTTKESIADKLFLGFSLSLFVLPILMVIIKQSVVYDDWRHVYFIYPGLVVFVGYALIRIKSIKLSYAFALIITIELLYTQLRLFPHQYVYFNAFIPKHEEYLRKHFEFDYWGVSNHEALEQLLQYDHSDTITVQYHSVILNNWLLLTEDQQKRIKVINADQQPQYFITNYRLAPQGFPEYQLLYSKKVEGSSIHSIFRIK
jgi:hypothetical protein